MKKIFVIIIIIYLTAIYVSQADEGDTTLSNNPQATFDNPFISDDQTASISTTLMSEADFVKRLKTREPEAIYISDIDSLENLGKSMGQLLLENQMTPIVMRIGDFDEGNMINSSPESLNLSGMDSANQSVWSETPAPPPEENLRGDEIDREILIAGGSGSLDRLTTYTFLFVEGNGDSRFDWTEERLNYSITQAKATIDNHVAKAKSFGIVLRVFANFEFVPINHEPADEPSGKSYSYGINVDNLDPWRSEVVGLLGHEANLRGLFKLNIDFKANLGCAEGVICFVINIDDEYGHQGYGNPHWAGGWINEYLVGKPFCTYSFNIHDSLHMAGGFSHEILHCFGAADEYMNGWHCKSEADCDATSGKLKGENINCLYCGTEFIPCVMIQCVYTNDICQHTAKQIGWLDSDNNGGSNVDDMPVDHSTLVTSNFELGDRLTIKKLNGEFVNAFIVSDYNSYLQPNGQRTVHILAMDCNRQIIAPSIYYLAVNGVIEYTINYWQDNNHPPMAFTDITSDSPYLKFMADGVAHINLEVTNSNNGEVYRPYAGQLIAGDNTVNQFLFNDGEWLPNGSYPYSSQGWTCDGVSSTKSGVFNVSYGVPDPWVITETSYNPETNLISASFADQDWTYDADLYEKDRFVQNLKMGCCGFVGGVEYIPKGRGSDSVYLVVKAYNPNGETESVNPSDLYAILPPLSPMSQEGKCVFSTVDIAVTRIYLDCLTRPVNPTPAKYDPQQIADLTNPMGKYCYYTVMLHGNAIKAKIYLHDNQMWSRMDKYVVECGGYEYGHYVRHYKTIPANTQYPGKVETIFWNLVPNNDYNLSVKSIDIRGNESDNGNFYTPYVSVRTGGDILPAGAPLARYEFIDSEDNIMPSEFSLSQNYPNPFNPTTEISFSLPITTDWKITIYNISGQKVEQFSGTSEAGVVTINWDASSQASGIYMYKAEAGAFSDTKKMLLLK